MKPDRDALEKTLHRHLSLFGSPSINQLDASRTRIRERLRLRQDEAQPVRARASSVRFAWRTGLSLAAAAAMIAALVLVPSRETDWLATVEAADGSRHTLAPEAVLRSSHVGGTMLTLKDGSRVEMRSQSELSLERAPDGIGIRLRTGGLLVDAAQQHGGHLYVHTKDVSVSVVGTMFVVNAEESGSRVTVIEGEVRVREGANEKALKPGEQVTTNPALAKRPMRDEIAWSVRASSILENFAKGMSNTAGALTPLTKPANAFSPAVAQAPSPDRPEFESASIRPCDPDNVPPPPDGARGGGVNSFQLIPGRLRSLCVTIATLVRTAYGYGPIDLDFFERGRGPLPMNFGSVYGLGQEDGRRVRGGPDWVRSERYTIEAVAGGNTQPSAETLRGPMLQRLLERRLQLKVHVESEAAPAFALTVARGGMKITPVTMPGGCDLLPGREGAPLIDGFPGSVLTPPRTFAEVRAGQKPSCGLWGSRNGPNFTFVGGGVPMSSLANVLAARLGGVRVIDRTNLGDRRFNFTVEFAVDDNAPGMARGDLPGRGAAADVPLAATIFTALEEELGLKLEKASTSREFVVIDQVERPTPN